MKISNSDIELFLNASNNNYMCNIGNKYIINKQLSDKCIKIYTILESNEVIAVHIEKNSLCDWTDDISYLRNYDIRNSKNYKKHLRRQNKVINKYGAENIIIMGFEKAEVYSKQMFKDKLAKKYINTVLEEENILLNVIEPKTETETETEEKNNIFEKKIDFKPICRNQLIKFIMKEKKKGNIEINITRLTKIQLVEIVKKILE